MAEVPRPAHPEAVAHDDTRILAAGIDDPENPVPAVLSEGLGLFSRDSVPIPRSTGIHHSHLLAGGEEIQHPRFQAAEMPGGERDASAIRMNAQTVQH